MPPSEDAFKKLWVAGVFRLVTAFKNEHTSLMDLLHYNAARKVVAPSTNLFAGIEEIRRVCLLRTAPLS